MIVQHLPRTRLDGACLWLDATRPVVVLSMRFERLDWFWFTLMHELDHAKQRDGLSSGGVVDSGLVGEGAVPRSEKPEFEQRADAFAENWLVPQRELDNFIARMRPAYSKERIRLFAKRLDVHPALVLGQLQFRKEIEYSHSREFLSDKLRLTITANALTDGWGHQPLNV
jgi:HTH-type transcriptional regulator/antitoxin HigA